MSQALQRRVLITDCADAKGLIAKITGVCFDHGLNIIKNDEFVDNTEGRFFMRTELEGDFEEPKLLSALYDVLPQQNHTVLKPGGRKRVVVMVTKEAHCLGDLLMKAYYGALDVDIAAVVGNYDNLRQLTEKFDIPYHFVSHEGLDRHQHEAALFEVIAPYAPDYLVLAKFIGY